MSNPDAQQATTYEHPEDLNSSDTASEPQSCVVSTAPGLGQGWSVLASCRFAADDLRKALDRVGLGRKEQGEIRFGNGLLFVRKLSNVIILGMAHA